MDIFGVTLSDVTAHLSDLWDFLLPFGADSRLHWTGLGAFILIGTTLYFAQRRALRDEGYTSFANYLVPMRLYRTASSGLDLKIYLANKLFVPLKGVIFISVFTGTALAVCGLAGVSMETGGARSGDLAIVALATILSAIATDLAYYLTHRASHEVAWLWPFHKVHHSAEVLTPITAKRNHPVFDLLLKAVTALLAGSMAGIIFWLAGAYEPGTFIGLGIFVILFNLAGGALRHSHIWLDYGPVLDRIFISPAQHQIHHSRAPEHHDKNYGLIFAVWDWMFGTLYVPREREQLDFGVADGSGMPEPQPHNTLVQAYTRPFQEAGAELVRHRRPRKETV